MLHVETSELWQPIFRLQNAADHKAVFLWPLEAAFVRPGVSNDGLILMDISGFLKGHFTFPFKIKFIEQEPKVESELIPRLLLSITIGINS